LAKAVDNYLFCEAAVFLIPIHCFSHGAAFEGAWTLLHDAYSKEQDLNMPQGMERHAPCFSESLEVVKV
jgi:hypothetical protein